MDKMEECRRRNSVNTHLDSSARNSLVCLCSEHRCPNKQTSRNAQQYGNESSCGKKAKDAGNDDFLIDKNIMDGEGDRVSATVKPNDSEKIDDEDTILNIALQVAENSISNGIVDDVSPKDIFNTAMIPHLNSDTASEILGDQEIEIAVVSSIADEEAHNTLR